MRRITFAAATATGTIKNLSAQLNPVRLLTEEAIRFFPTAAKEVSTPSPLRLLAGLTSF
jgi:hypothetical protein